MAVDPDAFDVPVVDYDFTKATSPQSLIEQMARAGGFTATKLATAHSILKDMRAEIDAQRFHKLYNLLPEQEEPYTHRIEATSLNPQEVLLEVLSIVEAST